MSKKEPSKRTRDASPRDKPLKRTRSVEPQEIQILSTNSQLRTPGPADTFLYEAEESKQYVPGELFSHFSEERNKLLKTMEKFVEYKSSRQDKMAAELMPQIVMHVMQFRHLNRLDKHRLKSSRDLVNENKQKIDEMNLKYQNLLYEISHIKKETKKCLEFRSQDEEVDLISLEDFYKSASRDICKPEITKKDPHQLTLARLNWELEQRKRLALKLKEAEVKKKTIKHKMKEMREKFSSVYPILEKISETITSCQDLGVFESYLKSDSHYLKFLSKPLLSLYKNAVAYADVYDGMIHVSIIDRKIDEMRYITSSRHSDADAENSDSDDNSVHWPLFKKDEPDILEKHNLLVRIIVPYEGSQLTLIFTYFKILDVVTVSVDNIDVNLHSYHKIGNIFQREFFLDSLFPGDNGRCLPNQSIISHLSESSSEKKPISFAKTGVPYKWVQKLCGLSHKLKITEQEMTETELADCVVETFSAICERLKARTSLVEQIETFLFDFKQTHRRRPVTELAYLFPTNTISQLCNWKVASQKHLIDHPNYKQLIKMTVFSEDNMMFKATIERGSAVLTAVIGIPFDYPSQYPVFILSLQWRDPCTSANDIGLRQMEEHVNFYFVNELPEKHKLDILTCQVHHLMSCFDIYVETDHSDDFIEGPREFARDKVVTRMQRGRDHMKPYKYLPNERIFTIQ